MLKLAYKISAKHGRLFLAGDRVDLLTRSGRALWSFARLQHTTEVFVAKNAFFALLDIVTVGGVIGKGTDVAKKAIDSTPGWLLTDQAKGQFGAFSFSPTHAKGGLKVVVGIMIARSAFKVVANDKKGRKKLSNAAKNFKEDALAALGFYRTDFEEKSFNNKYPDGRFMGMSLNSNIQQSLRLVTPFGTKDFCDFHEIKNQMPRS